MEENNKKVAEYTEQPEAENSTFDFATIYTTLILNWKWFLLSIIICLGTAAIYLRYKTPVYQASAKLLIKDNNTNTRRGMLNSSTFGTISNSAGIENEMEILTSHSLAQQAVRDLKLYTNYYSMGKVKEVLNYKTQPINVDVDPEHLEKLNAPISLTIEREGSKYHVEGTYYVSIGDNKVNGPYAIDKTLAQLPASIGTRAGILSFSLNGMTPMSEGLKLKVTITSPRMAAYKYVAALNVAQTNKSTTIAQLVVKDESPQRAMDYLQQLALCYNRQANEDKNEVAMRTE